MPFRIHQLIIISALLSKLPSMMAKKMRGMKMRHMNDKIVPQKKQSNLPTSRPWSELCRLNFLKRAAESALCIFPMAETDTHEVKQISILSLNGLAADI